ncbi:MAG: potassium transporter Trk [Betaproteobacteria bacterium RIFCSPLOWO2_12_FULL_65_14]|nr:MAG: potassium transporter Trk [Betaproteobacteria bacterium RIFCSPLOWO2_12_FULL_65_14]
MVHPFPVVHVFGPIVVLFGAAMMLPLVIAHTLADAARTAYDEAAVLTMVIGALLWAGTRRHRAELQLHHAYLLVALTWTALPAFAALPLMLGIPGLSFTDAYFETASAMTTTGATVLVGLDGLPPSINVWRAMLQWLGGMGVVVLAVAILPLLGVGGRQLFRAETPGPMKEDKLTPRMAQTAKGLWLVYFLLTFLGILAYRWAGMTWLDALIHSFTTMPLGGYSNHDASFAYFDSPLIESVAIVFMLIAGINFSTHFLAFSGRTFAPYRHDPEVLAFFLVLLVSVWGVAAYLRLTGTYSDLLTAARYAGFNVVSIATTTGYASTDYNKWPLFAPLWMLGLCVFASCSGSTGGGIKMIRAEVLSRHAGRLLKSLVHPRAHLVVKVRNRVIENQIIFAMAAFMLIFGVTTIVTVMLLAATGLDFLSAATAAIASITNTGPGLGVVGPAGNYASLTDFQKWVCTAAMLLGRLELFTLLVVFTPAFWNR